VEWYCRGGDGKGGGNITGARAKKVGETIPIRSIQSKEKKPFAHFGGESSKKGPEGTSWLGGGQVLKLNDARK